MQIHLPWVTRQWLMQYGSPPPRQFNGRKSSTAEAGVATGGS